MGKKKHLVAGHVKSSAMVASIAIHAVFIGIAVFFIAFKVMVDPPPKFRIPVVDRPRLPPRKIYLPRQRQSRSRTPKIHQTIQTKSKTPSIEIAIPDIGGFAGRSSYESGHSLSAMVADFNPTVFGKNKGTGNEFIGTFYDLKQTSGGEATGVDENACIEIINRFIGSGWNPKRFGDFFKAPKRKYATAFMMPSMGAHEAPKAFGVENQIKPSYWVCHYKGRISAPESGSYRFCGLGDDVLAVRIGKRLVLDACWHNKEGRLTDWKSDDENSRKYPLEGEGDNYQKKNSTLVIGDWFKLRKGEKIDMEVLIGELPGTAFSCRLFIEQEGKPYRMVPYSGGQRPVLPIFKTAQINEKLVPKMRIDPEVATLEGPEFGVQANVK